MDPATVVNSAGTQKWYNILTEGQEWRHNRYYIVKTDTDEETPACDPDVQNTELMTDSKTLGQPGPK